MTTTLRSVVTFALAASSTACDPGWHYAADHGTAVDANGLRYDVSTPSGLLVRLHASAFTGTLDVETTLTNTTADPITLRSPRLEVTDTRSVTLPTRSPRQTCPFVRGAWEIRPKASCTVTAEFAITPLVRGFLFTKNNPDLEHIRVKIATEAPRAFPDVEIAMTRME